MAALSTLLVMLAIARDELEAETPSRLHTSHAPKLLDADGMATHDTDEGGIGLPFTASFHRLLSLRERPRQTEYLMRGSMLAVDEWCARKHPTHDLDPVGHLCGQVLTLAVRQGWSPENIAVVVPYPEPIIRSLLIQALEYAADWRYDHAEPRARTAADIVVEELDKRRARRAEYDSVVQERTAHGGA